MNFAILSRPVIDYSISHFYMNHKSKQATKKVSKNLTAKALNRCLLRGYRPLLCLLELRIIQISVETACCKQLLVVTLLDDVAILHYQNQVCITYR